MDFVFPLLDKGRNYEDTSYLFEFVFVKVGVPPDAGVDHVVVGVE